MYILLVPLYVNMCSRIVFYITGSGLNTFNIISTELLQNAKVSVIFLICKYFYKNLTKNLIKMMVLHKKTYISCIIISFECAVYTVLILLQTKKGGTSDRRCRLIGL